MATESQSLRRNQTTAAASWLSRTAVITGPLFFAMAALLVFFTGPVINESDAVAKIQDFYAPGGGSNIQLIAEPLALVAMFPFLWLVGRMRTGIAHSDTNDYRAVTAFGGGVAFAVLAGASLIAQTTVAGTSFFSKPFEVDSHTAMLLGHLGYVLMAAAMMGAAVMSFATRGALRALGRPGLAKGTTVVGALSLIANFFVWVPLIVFLTWALVVGLVLSKTGQDQI